MSDTHVITFADMRDEAIDQIKAAFSAHKKIYISAHPGQFNEAEIRRIANQTPAILTSFMRYRDSGRVIDFVTWVIARADNKDRLYDGALKIVSAIIPVIRKLNTEWCIDNPKDIEAECLYTGALDQINVTLWGVKWSWQISEPVLSGGSGGWPVIDLEDFEGYDATHQIGECVVQDNIYMEDIHGSTV